MGRDAGVAVSRSVVAAGESEADSYVAVRKQRSILFVRSVALPLALKSLAAVRAGSPEARITVLTNEASARAIETTGHADEVIRYSAARFGIIDAGFRRLLPLRARHFDAVLVPYAGAEWLPFWNVGRFALALSARSTRWLQADSASSTIDVDTCERVTVGAWSRAMSPGSRARLTLVAVLKWPMLLSASLVALVMLAILAPLLFFFVWLTPPSGKLNGS
jgi:hypothetical protein